MSSYKRIDWIDNLKAFTCLLVVLGHLLQSLQKAGIDPYLPLTKFIDWHIYLFHMPLFIMLSGLLFYKTNKIMTFSDYKKFSFKKIINLLVPYFTFYLLYLLINIIFSSAVNTPFGLKQLIGIFNNPISPYWFLYALLSIFLFIPILEMICNFNDKIVFCFILFFKILSFFVNTKIYFLDSIMSWSLYFYLGKFIINRKNNKSIYYSLLLLFIFVFISMLFYLNKSLFGEIFLDFISVIFAVMGIFIYVDLFINNKDIFILNTFKKYTFQIFLLHTIFAAGIRIILLRFNVDNYFIHLFFGIIFGIYMPVLISTVSNKIKYTNFFFYPLKTIEELKGMKK